MTEPGNIKTDYSYNTNNQLTKIVDAQNNERSISYNIAGQRLSIEDLHASDDSNYGTRIYSYDDNGNIATFTTLAGELITYQYDELDRLTSETFTGSTTSFHYDSGSNAKGMLTSYSKGNYSESYTYNEQGFIIGETKSYATDNYSYSYDYDLLGQKVTTNYPDNSVITNSYENSVPTGVKYNNTDLVTTINHNPAGAIDDVTYGNGAITKNIYDYEYGYRLKKKGIMFGDAQYGLTSYTFDTVGNIINLKEDGNIPEFQKDITYSYDNLNRLTQANYSPSEIIDYFYNDIGNIMSNSRIGNYSYVDNGRNNPHAVTIAGTQSFSYDNNGNIINDSVNSYIYNAKDELTQSSNSGTVTNYMYNSQGVRIEKQTGDSVNRYVNKDYEVELIGTGSIINKYIFLGDTKIASVKTENNSESIIYHHADHLGGGNIDLDENGAILQVVDYYPFGEIRNQYNSSEYENKYKFGGKERDTESGLNYFEARYYGSVEGRFRSIDRVFWGINQDFLLNPQLQNGYSYVGNNPLKYIDPTGLWLESSDATSVFQEYIDRGSNLNYSFKITNSLGINIFGYKPFKTISNTLPEYLYKTAPHGEYDIKRNVDFMQKGVDINNNGLTDYNQEVQINGQKYLTSELGNFLVGLNGYRSGLSLDEINNYGLAVEGLKLEQGNGTLIEEMSDRNYYQAGYIYGILEGTGNFSEDQLSESRDYLLKKAKNVEKQE